MAKTPMAFRLDPKIVKDMRKWLARSGVPLTRQVEQALRNYLKPRLAILLKQR